MQKIVTLKIIIKNSELKTTETYNRLYNSLEQFMIDHEIDYNSHFGKDFWSVIEE